MLEGTCIWLLILLLDKSHLRLWHCVCSCRLQKPNVIKLWLRPKSELLHLWYSNLLSLITYYLEITKINAVKISENFRLAEWRDGVRWRCLMARWKELAELFQDPSLA